MFNDYEALKCDICKKEFTGRKPAEGGIIFCPDCMDTSELSIVDDGMPIPESVICEVTRGENQDGK